MNRELKVEDEENREKVIKHLRRADYLLVILPMVLAGILFFVVPTALIIKEKADGNSAGIGGFDFSGLLIFAGIVFCLIFCVGYGLLALLLSVLTRRNNTFRILLIVISLLTATVFGLWLFR
jgi:uncharacterized BrkB/YihY/UPF0761 family membrane protein